MKYLSQLSLRAKVLLLVLMGMFTLTAGSFFALSKMATAYQAATEETLEDEAVVIGNRIAAQYFERYGDVQAFAINQTVRELNQAKMPELLDSYVKLYGIYDIILVVDTNGNPLASNLKDTSGKAVNVDVLAKMNFKDAEWFKEVMAGRTTDSKALNYAGTYFEDFVLDPVASAAFGEERFATGFSTAIRNDKGEVVGVITNRAHPRWFETDLVDTLRALKEDKVNSIELAIVNSKGLEVFNHKLSDGLEIKHDSAKLLKKYAGHEANPAFAQAMKGLSGHDHFTNTDGVDMVVGFHHIQNMKWPTELGWSILIAQSEEEALASVTFAKNLFYALLAACLFVASTVSFVVAKKISASVADVTEVLAANGAEVAQAAARIASSSTQLSEASTEQAAALQQTVASVDEISAMVQKNAESANRSKESSANSRQAAEGGRRTVESMLQAIDEIDQSNSEISTQMDESNRQLSEITKLISDIGSKTKVINEIVFQTKLLSFNASVEAARAGEYGKGFAVVAEEVGNLAEMSGTAAKEITALLDESTRKVDHIVSETKTRVERSMTLAREKVAAGSATAKECNQSLEDILRYVQEVDALVSEIAVASNEQSTGVREISNAVGQMEQVTQQNTAVAQSSSVAAEQLSLQSAQLNEMVGTLSAIVGGGAADQTLEDQKPASGLGVKASRATKTLKSAKVLRLAKREPKAEAPAESSHSAASGGDTIPSANDPRFNE
jgi:methyl-accepting chemotaxis protein